MFAICKIARFGLLPLLLAGMALLPAYGQIHSGISSNQPPNGAAAKPSKNSPGTKTPVPTTQGALIGPPIDQMQPPPTPTPQTPAQSPPAAPRIIYQNGLLTVDSTNARLGDILNAIHTQTGVQFEGLQSANDRVAFRMGPAPVDEVLTELLRGSRFDYMILGSPENAGIVQRVVLTPRAGGATVTAGEQPPAQQRPPSGDDEEGGEDQGTAEGASTEQAPPRVVQPPAPQQVQPNANGPKTTQQLLDELKQMQQQQQNQNPQMQNQQMPNQQNPPAPIKPPLRPSVPQ